ncbi:MAG: hypothetical protein Q8O70_04885 [Burkholderiales bacterium]|nr:hypothetical protein [Burkholderiales bacterium]
MKVGQRKITQIADVFDGAIRKNHRSAHYAQAFDRGKYAWIQPVGNSPEEFRSRQVGKARREIRCQSGSCFFFPRDASFDAVHARDEPPREPFHDLASHPPAHSTEIAADPEACAAHAPWWSFLAVS